MRRVLTLALAVALVLLAGTVAYGYWTAGSTSGSAGQAKAGSLPKANAPTVVALGQVATVVWTPNVFTAAPLTYTIQRYASSGGAPTGSPISVSCGSLTTLGNGDKQCIESLVPVGTWHYTVQAKLNNWTGAESDASAALPIFNDAIAPTTTASLSPAANAAGWNMTSPVSVTLTATDNIGGSGVTQTTYTLDGSDPRSSGTAIVYSGAISIAATTTVKFSSRDNAGNVEAVKSQAVRIDTAAPTNGLALSNVTGGAYLAGPNIWYRGSAAGSFKITNTVGDSGGSGAASSTTTSIAAGSGWNAHTGSTVIAPAGGPFVSNTFSWNAGATATPTETVTAADAAGNTAAAPVLTMRNDITPPVSSASSSVAAGGSGWVTSTTTVTLSSTDAAGSGVASIKYTTDGSNPISSGTAVVYSGPFSASSTVRYAATDNVGNQEAPKTLQIDTVAPASSLALTVVSGRASLNTTTNTIWYRGTAAGSFRLVNTVTDADSGAASSATATLTGTTTGWTHTGSLVSTPAGGPFTSNLFSWSAGTGSAPSELVTTRDAAGNSSARTLAFAADTNPPTGSIIFPGTGPYGSGAAWNAGCSTPAVADICGTVVDSGAGVASVAVDLNRSDGSCWDQVAQAWSGNNCGNGGFSVPFTAGATPSWTLGLPCSVGNFTIQVTVADTLGLALTLGPVAYSVTSCA